MFARRLGIIGHHTRDPFPMINRTTSYLPDGTRILAHDPWKSGSVAFVQLKVNRDGTRSLLTEDGFVYEKQEHGAYKRVDSSDDNLSIAWAGPFPALTDVEIVQYYGKLSQVERLRRHSFNPALLVHLTSISNDGVRGRIVEGIENLARHGREDDESNRIVMQHLVVSGTEINLATSTLPDGIEMGDVLISSDFFCEASVNDNKSLTYVVTLENPFVLGNAPKTEQLLSLIPDSTSTARSSEYEKLGFTFQSFDIMSAGDVRYQEDAARAKTEPDLGLFLSVPDENGECYPAFLTGTGIHLFGHSLRSVEDLLETPCPPQGVWAYENPHFWAGATQTDIGPEWSEELSGSFVPATPDHLAQLGYSMDELGEAILEYMLDNRHDISGDPVHVAHAWMELAPAYENEQALTI